MNEPSTRNEAERDGGPRAPESVDGAHTALGKAGKAEGSSARAPEGDLREEALAGAPAPPLPRPAAPAAPAGMLADRVERSAKQAPMALDRAARNQGASGGSALASSAAKAAAEAPGEERSDFKAQQAAKATASADATPTPPMTLAALRARLQSEPELWTWSRDGASDRHPATALAAWLGDAEQAMRAAPSAAGGAAANASTNTAANAATNAATSTPDGAPRRAAGAPVGAIELRLFEGGRLEATLRVTPSAIELVDRSGRTQRTPLDPATAAALAAALPR